MKKIILATMLCFAATGCKIHSIAAPDNAIKHMAIKTDQVKPVFLLSDIDYKNLEATTVLVAKCDGKSIIDDCLEEKQIKVIKDFSLEINGLPNIATYKKNASFVGIDATYGTEELLDIVRTLDEDAILVDDLKNYINYMLEIYHLNNQSAHALKSVAKENHSKMMALLSLDKADLVASNKEFKGVLDLMKAAPAGTETPEAAKARRIKNHFIAKAAKSILNLRKDKTEQNIKDAIESIDTDHTSKP